MSFFDYNTAEQDSGDIIPDKTLVKVHMKLRPGGYDDPAKGWTGGYAKRSDNTGAIYLDAEFTVMGGKFNKRKVWTLIGLHSSKGPKWGDMGRTFVRAALESARSIRPDDGSDSAMKARQISGFSDLDGIQFIAKIGVEEGQDGYEDKNVIRSPVPVTHKEYAALMAGGGTTPTPSAGASQAGQQAASAKPSWAD